MNPVTADWANFFVAQVGASAALTGLVVVAISVNLSRILSFPQLPGRAAESLLTLLGALILTSLALVPQQASVFGAEVLATGVLMFLGPLTIQLRSLKLSKEVTAKKRSLRMVVSAAVAFPLIGAKRNPGSSSLFVTAFSFSPLFPDCASRHPGYGHPRITAPCRPARRCSQRRARCG